MGRFYLALSVQYNLSISMCDYCAMIWILYLKPEGFRNSFKTLPMLNLGNSNWKYVYISILPSFHFRIPTFVMNKQITYVARPIICWFICCLCVKHEKAFKHSRLICKIGIHTRCSCFPSLLPDETVNENCKWKINNHDKYCDNFFSFTISVHRDIVDVTSLLMVLMHIAYWHWSNVFVFHIARR